MMRRFFIIIILIIFAIQILPWALIFVGMVCEPNPPAPEIKYGEFPLKIEYSINGEQFVVEDTIICEYDGIGMNEGVGKYRKWKNTFASGKKQLILFEEEGINENYICEDRHNVVTTVFFDFGSGGYYMGELDDGIQQSPSAIWTIKDEGKNIGERNEKSYTYNSNCSYDRAYTRLCIQLDY